MTDIASFPGLPHFQFLIACILQAIKNWSSMQAIKNWRCGRPGNEAMTDNHSVKIS